MTAGMIVVGVSAWHLARGSDVAMFTSAIRLALPVVFVAALFTSLIGHAQAQLMTTQQPMKMAAAEALYTTRSGAPFSLFAVAPFEHTPTRSTFDVAIPHGLSILATNSWNGKVEGINDLERAYRAKYGPGDYAPIVGVTYWTFRIMTGIGFLVAALSALGMLLLWRGTLETSRRYLRVAHVRDRPADPRERERLDLHRDGPAAVGRAGAAEDIRLGVAERLGVGGRADPRRVHAALRPARGCRRVVDVPVREERAPGCPGSGDGSSPEAARDLSMAY